jgi:hypothetical protein
MNRALQMAREYGVAVRFAEFGDWSNGELRAEYDPTVPEIRINQRIAASLSAKERERFVQSAVAHELYHHRERLGEVPVLQHRDERERAASRFAESLVGESTTPTPRVLNSGEILWKYDEARDRVRRFAAEGRIVLGFDIVEFVDGNVRIWGSQNYGRQANSDLVIKDIERIEDLTGLEPPYGDLWFTFVTELKEQQGTT